LAPGSSTGGPTKNEKPLIFEVSGFFLPIELALLGIKYLVMFAIL
jgi:hypothetical protein